MTKSTYITLCGVPVVLQYEFTPGRPATWNEPPEFPTFEVVGLQMDVGVRQIDLVPLLETLNPNWAKEFEEFAWKAIFPDGV